VIIQGTNSIEDHEMNPKIVIKIDVTEELQTKSFLQEFQRIWFCLMLIMMQMKISKSSKNELMVGIGIFN